MDEGMEDLAEDRHVEIIETDEDYEFDASQFFDFTRPEFDSEIEEAERWFEVCGDYAPSPFIVKLNIEKLLSMEVVPNASNAKGRSYTKPINANSRIDSKHGVAAASKKNEKGEISRMYQDTAKAKTTTSSQSYQPRSSTLMKPTASLLAKQDKLHEMQATRFQRTTTNVDEKGLQSPTRIASLTKRQKLEIGYLRKIAHLKHHISFLHKSSKKVTVPREPELETLLRAQRRSSKNSSVSSENEKEKLKGSNFKARPLNKKILQTPPPPQTRKSTLQSPEFQVFHLKTTERANQHASAKVSNRKSADPCITNGVTNMQRPNSRETLKPEKQEVLRNSKTGFLREKVTELSTRDKLLEVPPVEQFSKLSLGSDMEENNTSQSKRHVPIKELKENVPSSFQSEFWRNHVKPNQCGGHLRMHEARCSVNITRDLISSSNHSRSLGIR